MAIMRLCLKTKEEKCSHQPGFDILSHGTESQCAKLTIINTNLIFFDFHKYFRLFHFVPTTQPLWLVGSSGKKPNPFHGGFGKNHCTGYLTWTLMRQESLPSIVPLQYTWKHRNYILAILILPEGGSFNDFTLRSK